MLAAYPLVLAGLFLAKRLMRAIDDGDLAKDGRTIAFFGWAIGMAGSALTVPALFVSVF